MLLLIRWESAVGSEAVPLPVYQTRLELSVFAGLKGHRQFKNGAAYSPLRRTTSPCFPLRSSTTRLSFPLWMKVAWHCGRCRDIRKTILDLDNACQEEKFIYTFSFIHILLHVIRRFQKKLPELTGVERPNHRELAFSLGLMVQRYKAACLRPVFRPDGCRMGINRILIQGRGLVGTGPCQS